jgi:hypothetical protein
MRRWFAGCAAVGIASVLSLNACSDDEDGSTDNGGGQGQGAQGGSGAAGGSGGGGSGGGSGECVEITGVSMFANAGVQFWFGEPTPALGGADPDYLDLELAESAMGTSTFSLVANLLDCADTANCLRVVEDEGQDATGAYYAATSGELALTAVDMPYYITGTISDATLVEVEIGDMLEITEVPGGRCVHIAELSFAITSPAPGWECPPGYYDETGQGNKTIDCDCECGALDPDCNEPTNPILGCEDGQTCAAGTCEGTPTAWTCAPGEYDGGVGNGCDCNCGTADPDCDLMPAETVQGCAAGDVCDSGVCIPMAWTCDPSFYASGIADDCDCGCGALDPDCEDANVDKCDYCDDVGSCSATACPGTINPTNNAVCN